MSSFNAQNLAFLGFIAIAIILLGFAALVLWKIFMGEIGLDGRLAEPAFSHQNGTKKLWKTFRPIVAPGVDR